MATRRARIKAIVNVPARRSKANDDINNTVPPKSPISKESPAVEINIDKATIPSKEVCESKAPNAVVDGEKSITIPYSECILQDNSKFQATNSETDNSLESNIELPTVRNLVPEVGESEKKSTDVNNSLSVDQISVKITSTPSISESEQKSTANDNLTEKLDQKKNSEVASVSSPIKQRTRLFIRPSPKIVDVGGRGRYPSGNRHKTLSESEEEPRNRSLSCAIDESENPVPDSSSRTAHSEKVSDGQETQSTNLPADKAVADNRKNGNVRSGRQRARNKENRASDSRRRLWLQMKKGNGSGGPLDRSRLTMFDYIYYNPVSNPMRSSSESSDAGRGRKTSITNSEQSSALMEEQVDDPGEGNSLGVSENNQAADQGNEQVGQHEVDEGGGMPAPRVKVGPDGELIVDEQSLVIATTGLKEGLEDLEKGPALVESSSFTNYATYSKRSKGLEWSENETLRFYRALNVVGTDFSVMQNVLFPNRSRRDLKNKFKREERRNSSLIEKALRNPEIFSSVEELQTEFAKTVSAEKQKEETKKMKGKSKAEGQVKRKAEKEPKPAKKKKSRQWIVDGNVSEGDSESDLPENAPSKLSVLPENETLPEVVPVSLAKVVTSSVDDDITMCSQEIVVTNNDCGNIGPRFDESESECSHAKDESDGEESVSSESQFFSRVLVPTRSGRVPKRKDIDSGHHQVNQTKLNVLTNRGDGRNGVNVANNGVESVRKGMEVIICSKEAEDTTQEPSKDPLAVELTRFPSTSAVGTDFVNTVEPGSLVVIATCSPDDPSRQVLQLFMVSPGDVEDGGRVLIPQNLPGGCKVMDDRETEEMAEYESSTVVTIKNPSNDYQECAPTNPPGEELSSCTIVVDDSEAG
ncbi:uncharacterized protein Bdp1 [Hetaerina americana]|uniref:uncharacterized protein Bdp1 n=1 Tax=Hetaerina americana TaxID=62018 RepID=UPI003A7F1FF8